MTNLRMVTIMRQCLNPSAADAVQAHDIGDGSVVKILLVEDKR
jgi:hypothetical protein